MKRWLRYSLLFLLLLAAGGGLLLAALDFYLPRYIESSLLPDLSAQSGLAITGSVRRVGLTGADLSGVRIGPAGAPAVSVDSLRLDYSLTGLLSRQLRGIEVSGLTIEAAWEEGKLILPGFGHKGPDTSPDDAAGAAPPQLPIAVRDLAIRHAALAVQSGSRSLRIPFTLSATLPGSSDEKPLAAELVLVPAGQKITLQARVDLGKHKAHVDLDAPELNPAALADLVSFSNGKLSGDVGLSGSLDLDLAPFAVTAATFDCTFQGLGLDIQGLSLRQAAGDPARLQLKQFADGSWSVAGDALAFAAPVALQVVDLHGRLVPGAEGLAVDGGCRCRVLPQEIGKAGLVAPLALGLKFAARQNRDGGWKLSASGGRDGDDRTGLAGRAGEVSLTAGAPRFKIEAGGGNGPGDFSVSASLEALKVATGSDGTAAIPSVELSAKGKWPFDDSGKSAVALAIPKVVLQQGANRVTLAGISLAGPLRFVQGAPNWQGELLLKDGELVSDQAGGAAVKGMTLTLPLGYPAPEKGKPGSLAIRAVQWQGKEVGSLAAEVAQQGLGLRFSASQHNLLVPGLVATVAGRVGFSPEQGLGGDGTFGVNDYRPAAPLNLGRLVPAAAGFTLAGSLSMDGSWQLDRCGIKGSVKMGLNDGELRDADRDLTVQGIDVGLRFDDLTGLRSGPRQRLTFRRLALGELEVTDGAIDFQVESPQSILIEKGRFQWCKGHIDAQSLRITPGRKDYDFVLYCDRLHFASVLGQLGAATGAAGEGRVNGRIAVHIQDGKFRFDDGFLFSTPGEGGTVSLSGAENLTEGIPKDSAQFTQVDLAREALRDYAYEWARLGVSSEGDNLLLRLQMNGKPSRPLPFVFNKEIGGFARVQAGSPGSVFQGIRLDVNFRLPLDTILYYGSSIKKVLK